MSNIFVIYDVSMMEDLKWFCSTSLNLMIHIVHYTLLRKHCSIKGIIFDKQSMHVVCHNDPKADKSKTTSSNILAYGHSRRK